eukprot:CAMPEP_0119123928 /NCGR_PEP_ID=MMETSP1310-20130426/3700_1 /TAXON_ID=464262 /ORGANISM="Genus nov. species nov., Strain RCC2339" /LENGTH=314 /DNA_ID=CAMNT_0007113801 /DNA_START=183 /DNA_END=1127 /DNA_ORIENTATION=-
MIRHALFWGVRVGQGGSWGRCDAVYVRRLHVERETGTLGALVKGVHFPDLASDADLFNRIRSILNEHGVVVFRDQEVTVEEQKAVSARFGDLESHPLVQGIDGHPEVIQWTRSPTEKVSFGEDWHSDNSYKERPTSVTCLYGVDVPPYGSDTLFACMRRAFKELSPTLQSFLGTLTASHGAGRAFSPEDSEERKLRYVSKDKSGRKYKFDFEVLHKLVSHPIVRTIPETQAKALFINQMFTYHIDGLGKEESRHILEMLFSHMARPEFQMRVRWQQGTLLLWDNRVVQHLALNDSHPTLPRTMRRVCCSGERPV